jgi:hypothetical protein
MATEWVNGSRDFAVSDRGFVFNGSLVDQPTYLDESGYHRYDYNNVKYFVHELIWEQFMGKLSHDEIVQFKNNDKNQLYIDNLQKLKMSHIVTNSKDTYVSYRAEIYAKQVPSAKKSIEYGTSLEQVKEEVVVPKSPKFVTKPEDLQTEKVETVGKNQPSDFVHPEKGSDITKDQAKQYLIDQFETFKTAPTKALKILRDLGVTVDGKTPSHFLVTALQRSKKLPK